MHAVDITELLRALNAGREDAAGPMVQLLYHELRGMAERRLLGSPGRGIQPTSLVHEAYLRLVAKSDRGWASRRHFYAAAARAMRDILVERARRAGALKRGGGRPPLSLEEPTLETPERAEELLAIDDALEELKGVDGRAAEVVLLRYFSGLTGDETADVLGVSPSTVDRRWQYAKAWLHRRLQEPPG